MSIATLKRKTEQKYNSMSVGLARFSISGGTRSQGYVGQSNLMRHFPMTPHRGNTARGNGGLNGQYRQTNIISGINYQNNSSIIKPSVIGTYGCIATKYRWIRRPQPFSSTKPDVNMNLNDQSSYIAKLEKNTIAYIDSQNTQKTNSLNTQKTNSQNTQKTKPISKYPCPFPRANYLNYNSIANSSSNITKNIRIATQSEYLISLDKACGAFDATNLPVQTNRVPTNPVTKLPKAKCHNGL